MSLNKKITDYYKKNRRILFTTPSHAQGSFVNESSKKLLGEKFFKCDFSEIDGFDNLRNPQGILKDLQEKISGIYDSKCSFMLTNGSSSGITALMLSVLKEKDIVLIARNCHISVYNGLVLSGAKPVWLMPEFDRDWGIFKGISAEEVRKALQANRNTKALILTSPTYEGNFSDIEEISKITKEYNVKLIVDEAHGALLNFASFKAKPAILSGADASVQSLHKTAGAPNPCALIHMSKETSVKKEKVQESLNLINTTSPSYPLLSAIESCVDFLASNEGIKHIENLFIDINNFKNKLNTKIKVYDSCNDPTKLLIKIEGTGGFEAASILNNEFNIEEEFSNSKSMLFITGIGTDQKKFKKLEKALNKIKSKNPEQETAFEYSLPEMLYTPREVWLMGKTNVNKKESVGKISAETIVSYPPGIPIIIAGERIRESDLNKIEQNVISICN